MTGEAVSVRGLRGADIPTVIEVFRASVRKVARRDYTLEQVIAWAPDEIDSATWAKRYETRQGWVAEVGSKVVGFAELEGRDHLDMIYVHPAHQGQGAATALLTHLERAAHGLGARRLRTEASITARPFFEHRGFRLVAEQTVAVRGQSFINYRMEKPLAGMR